MVSMFNKDGAGVSAEPSGNGKTVGRPAVVIVGKKRIYAYNPTSDINVQELAQAVILMQFAPLVLMRVAPPEVVDVTYEQFSEEVKRHFAVKEIGSIVVPPQGSSIR